MKNRYILYIAMIVAAGVWGGSFVVMKDSLKQQDVFSFLASRFILAAILMFLYRPKSLVGLKKQFVTRASLVGVLTGLGFTFQTYGLTLTTVSNTGFITGLYIVFTPLISLLLLRRRVIKIQWIAVIIATLGIYFISYNGVTVGLGEILVFISSIIFAAQLVALGEWSDGKNTYALTFIQILVVSVLFTGLSIPRGFQMPPNEFVWQSVIFTAVFATFFAFLVQTQAQAIMSATTAGVIFAMETPFALLFGLYFDNDPLTRRIIAGGALIIMAMALVIWSDSKSSTTRRMSNSGK